MSVLKAVHLKKYYGEEPNIVKALDDVSVEIEQGEFTAVVGTSGSGKSTLLNMLGGLDVPTGGGVWIRGLSLSDMEAEERTVFRRRNIGFVFQQYNLVPVLSIFENIVLPLRLDGAGIDAGLLEAVTESLGIADKLERLPGMLSEVSSSGLQLPVRLWQSRQSCWPMNQPAAWILPPVWRSWDF